MTTRPVNSTVSFSLKKLMLLNIEGRLADLKGTVKFDAEDLGSSFFDVSIGTAQISTDNPKRDEHLRSQDFFAVDQYPSISFKSSSIDKRGDGYLVRGHLTILDATQEILIPFSFNSDTFKGQFVLNRLDFGLGKKFPTFFISNAVEVSIDCKVAAEVEV